MELNWSTFLLEIINFLVLIWILQRFLYRPVLAVIAKRRAGIEQSLSEAQTLRTTAEALQAQYESRLDNWEQEKQTARAELQRDIEAERQRLLADLQTTLQQEREKNRLLEEHRLQALQRQAETEALAQASQFASRLLSRLAGPELEARLIELAIDELQHLPEERLSMLREACSTSPDQARISSAFTLTPPQRDTLQHTLQTLLEQPVACTFEQNPQLLSGLRITIGPWLLRANLRDELMDFTAAAEQAMPSTSAQGER